MKVFLLCVVILLPVLALADYNDDVARNSQFQQQLMQGQQMIDADTQARAAQQQADSMRSN